MKSLKNKRNYTTAYEITFESLIWRRRGDTRASLQEIRSLTNLYIKREIFICMNKKGLKIKIPIIIANIIF